MISCLLHAHSTYSDGEFTLAELREVALREGRAAVLLADHAEYFDDARLASYVAECEHLSDVRLRLVPGLEFNAPDRMHIVGYGVTACSDADTVDGILEHIARHGGVSVIAHPRDDHFALIERLARLPQGIEAWNTKYDGRYAPRAETFALIERLRRRAPELLAFYGSDLHWRRQFRGLDVRVDARSNAATELIAALRAGAFEAHKGTLRLSPRETPPPEQLRSFRLRNTVSRSVWRTLKAVSGGIGKRLPAPVKAHLRRIF